MLEITVEDSADLLMNFSCQNSKNISLEIGFGSGDNINYMLNNESDSYFIGAEVYQNGIAKFLRNLDKNFYGRIKIFKDDFRIFLDHVPNNFFTRIIILYPDPWIKRRHRKRRILNLENIEIFFRVIKSGGLIYIATDIKEYFTEIIENFNKTKKFSILNKDKFHKKPDVLGETKYEKKAKNKNISSFFLEVKKTSG